MLLWLRRERVRPPDIIMLFDARPLLRTGAPDCALDARRDEKWWSLRRRWRMVMVVAGGRAGCGGARIRPVHDVRLVHRQHEQHVQHIVGRSPTLVADAVPLSAVSGTRSGCHSVSDSRSARWRSMRRRVADAHRPPTSDSRCPRLAICEGGRRHDPNMGIESKNEWAWSQAQYSRVVRVHVRVGVYNSSPSPVLSVYRHMKEQTSNIDDHRREIESAWGRGEA